MFISAAMLVYAYPDLPSRGLGVFWRRRLLAVVLPYFTWTLVYFVLESLPVKGIPGSFKPTGGAVGSWAQTLEHFGYLLATGYYQLYFLVLLLEFYLVYPAFLWLLRRTARHPLALVLAGLAAQLTLGAMIHWRLGPGWLGGFWGMREIWNYTAYLVVGGVMALHYEAVHGWFCRHWRAVLALALGAVALAEAWFLLGDLGIYPALAGRHDSSGAYQPVLVPAFLGLVATIYLIGVALAHPKAPARLRAWAQAGADNSYGIYLSQVLFISVLSAAGWGRLNAALPWPVVVGGAVVVVFFSAATLTAVLARLPGARASAGRPRRPWRRPSALPAAYPMAPFPTTP
jgi:peptidoglycan/LPS O-acetylase OafA/YrhL